MQKLPGWMKWCLHSPKFAILLFIALCAVTATGASQLYFRGDYKVFFEPDNPQRKAFEDMQVRVFLIIEKAMNSDLSDTLSCDLHLYTRC